MRDLGLSRRIKQRISEGQHPYSMEKQKAELLLRNQQFLEERERVGVPLLRGLTGKGRARYKSREFSDAWQNFNYRWWIDGWWDGSDTTLWKHVLIKPGVFFRDPESGIVWILGRDFEHPYASNQKSEKEAFNIADEGAFIYIKINPWTLREDLRKLEPTIHKLREKVFRYSVREMEKFSRDLCWYDLHEKPEFGKLSYTDIQKVLNEHNPRQRAQPRKRIIAAVGRIRIYIKRLTPISARFSPRP